MGLGGVGPPTVDKAEVSRASGWMSESSDPGSNNLSLGRHRYGKVRLNLSSSAPENSSEVEDVSLHTVAR